MGLEELLQFRELLPEGVEESPSGIAEDNGWKYELVSTVAYLIGVPKENFTNGRFIEDIFFKMDNDVAARIIRNLCIIRTCLFKNNTKIYSEITYSFKNLSSLPELVPTEVLLNLEKDGIILEQANCKLNDYYVRINDNIKNRINNCRKFFNDWLNWDYIKELFIIPGGEEVVTRANIKFNANWNYYPYHCFINSKSDEIGNILNHDSRFVKQLYWEHGETFTDETKVRNATGETKTSIYEFLKRYENTVLLVDCENSDVYKLYAAIKELGDRELMPKLSRIVLFDDFHTTDAWQILSDFTDIPVEYHQIDRIKEDKSLVDQALMITATKLSCRGEVDSFIIASSDSDYWELIRETPDAGFLVMVEHDKCGNDIKVAMESHNILYTYLDDFATSEIQDIKTKALFKELNCTIKNAIRLNIVNMLDDAITQSRMTLTSEEREAYLKRLKKNIHLEIMGDGEVKICLQ